MDRCQVLRQVGMLLDRWKVDEAELLAREVFRRDPSPWPRRFLARCLAARSALDEAAALLDELPSDEVSAGHRVERALLLPIVHPSDERILAGRVELAGRIDALQGAGLRLDDPAREVGIVPFMLAYQGHSDRELLSRLARFYLSACPRLAWTAPHCREPRRPSPDRPLRLGVVSSNFRDNTVGPFFLPLIAGLGEAGFDLRLYAAPSLKEDGVSERFRQAAAVFSLLPAGLAEAQERVARDEPDLLFYPDAMVNAFTHFLAYARLAPLQFATWGHPTTTGIPNMDCYLSSRRMEPEGAQAHYSEELLLLDDLPTGYRPARLWQTPLRRSDFALPEEGRLYMCGHQAFKFHPRFDELMAEILREDPESHVILINAWGCRGLTEAVHGRFAARHGALSRRLLILDPVDRLRYLSLARLVDLHLDPPFFGGGRTSYDLLANGKVVVTWPGPMQRGRVTAALYGKMGIDDGVVSSLEDYPRRVVELGRDASRRASLERRILAASSALDMPADLPTRLADRLRARLAEGMLR